MEAKLLKSKRAEAHFFVGVEPRNKLGVKLLIYPAIECFTLSGNFFTDTVDSVNKFCK